MGRKLMQIEAKFSQFYFKQIFRLVPKKIKLEGRKTFKAYDEVNNLFNLAYEHLAWKVHITYWNYDGRTMLKMAIEERMK